MRVKINYAGGEANVPLSGAYRDVSSAGMVARATAQTASEISDTLVSFVDQKMRRDAASITTDSLTRMQQSATEDFISSKSKSHSTLNPMDANAKISDVDVLVDDPESKYNGKSFVEYNLGTFDDKVKGELSRVTNHYARRELEGRFASLRASYHEKVMDYHSRAITESKLVGADKALDRMSMLVKDQPDMLTQNMAMLHNLLDNSGLDPITAESAKQKFSPELAEAAVMGYATLDPLLGEAKLKDPNSDFQPYLSEGKREQLTFKIDQMKSRAASQVYTDVVQSVESAEQSLLNTGREVPGFNDKVMQLSRLDPDRAAPIIERITLARDAHMHKVRMDGLPLAKLDEYVDQFRATPGASGYAQQSKMHTYLSDMVDKQRTLAKTDPAALVDHLFPEEMLQIPDEDLAGKMAFRESALASKGMDSTQTRLLTNAEADGIISAVKQSNPNNVLQYMQSLAQQVDANGTKYSWKLFQDLSARENGLDPMYQALFAKMQDPDQGVGVTYDMLNAIRVRKDLDSLMAGDEKKKTDFDRAVTSQMAKWQTGYLKGSQASRATAAASMKSAVTTLAKYYYQSSGDLDSSVTRAYRSLIGDSLYPNYRPDDMLMIPKSVVERGAKIAVSDKAVRRDMRVVQNQVVRGNIASIDVQKTFGPVYAGDEYKTLREDTLRRAEWKTNEDFTGAYLLIKRAGGASPEYSPVLKTDGTPFVLKFSDSTKGGIYSDDEKRLKREYGWFD